MSRDICYARELDFIKGIAILCVILLHTLNTKLLYDSHAYFHIWQAVPLFLFISTTLLLVKVKNNRESYYSIKSIKKLYNRIILPFIIVEGIAISKLYLFSGSGVAIIALKQGYGSGAYYPFVYVQLWLIIPLVYDILSKCKRSWLYFLLVCFIFNIVTYNFFTDKWLYSKSITRYLFIIPLAYYWNKGKQNLLLWTSLSLISISYYFAILNDLDFTPWLDERWKMQQLPAFFYTTLLFGILVKTYSFIQKKITLVFEWLGKN